MVVRGAEVTVDLPDGRRHRVSVDELDDGIRLTGRIATRGAIERLDSPELVIWLRNRTVPLVGFHFDKHGSLVGEARAPRVGLDADELCFYVRTVAAECDRLEALLTGEDVE